MMVKKSRIILLIEDREQNDSFSSEEAIINKIEGETL